jgi:hypothetical protein
MLCYRCGKQGIPAAERWGFVASTVCQGHWDAIRTNLTEVKDHGIAPALFDDYARIYVLMEERETVRACMRELASELGDLRSKLANNSHQAFRPTHAGDGFLNLSAALAKYEAYCWFPPSHELFVGQLSNEQFNSYVARGLMAKDPGAGVNHGDFTHRLQWHAIARIVTQRFTRPKSDVWAHTPLELYTSMGGALAVTHRIWFQLLDDNGSDRFRSPDIFHWELRNGRYGILSINVGRRFEKRFREVASQLNEEDKVGKRRVTATAEFKTFGGRALGAAANAYAERKREKFHVVGNAPVIVRQPAAIGPTIEERLTNSRSSLQQEELDSRQSVAYSQRLGIVTRPWGRGDRNLKELL